MTHPLRSAPSTALPASCLLVPALFLLSGCTIVSNTRARTFDDGFGRAHSTGTGYRGVGDGGHAAHPERQPLPGEAGPGRTRPAPNAGAPGWQPAPPPATEPSPAPGRRLGTTRPPSPPRGTATAPSRGAGRAPSLPGAPPPPHTPPTPNGSQGAQACVAALKAAQAGRCEEARSLLTQCSGRQAPAFAQRVAQHCG